jgi:hypothetical protein
MDVLISTVLVWIGFAAIGYGVGSGSLSTSSPMISASL